MELRICKMQFAHLFHIYLLWPIDHDFCDGIVLQKRFYRSKTKDFITDIRNKARSFTTWYSKRVFTQDSFHISGNQRFHFLTAVIRSFKELLLFRSHFIDDSAMHCNLQILISLLNDFISTSRKNLAVIFIFLFPKTFKQCHCFHPLSLILKSTITIYNPQIRFTEPYESEAEPFSSYI